MVGEGLQNYVTMVSGLTKTTKAKAAATAKALLAQTGLEEVATDAGERVSKLAEEIVAASRANRELLQKLIESEVDRAAGRFGFARTEDLEVLRREIAELRLGLAHASAQAAGAGPASTPGTGAAAGAAPARRPPAKKVARKTPATRTATARSATTRPAAAKSAKVATAKTAPRPPSVQRPPTETPAEPGSGAGPGA